MEILFDCLPCMLRQVLEASRMVTDDNKIQADIMKDSINVLSNYKNYTCSPELALAMHQIVKKHTGTVDPYENIKKDDINSALKVYPMLENYLVSKQNSLYWALKIAATGNIIDSAIYKNIDIEGCVEQELEKEFAICDLDLFENKLKTAKNILIIGDNAGETVFDKILIKNLAPKKCVYAVRNLPIINDATIYEAKLSGLDECAEIISSGSNAPGAVLSMCNLKFIDIYNNCDLIISKGQGNFEALSGNGKEIFFLLKAKCSMIANRLGVNIGDYVFVNYLNKSTR